MDFNFFPNVRLGDEPFVGIFCGAKGSGKTTLLLDILKSVWRHVFNLIVIVSPTFSLQSLSHEIDGRGVIVFSEFRQCILQQISELQEEKKYEQEDIQERLRHPELLTFRDPKSPPEDHHVLLIFDDIGSLGREGKLGMKLADLCYVVRHFKISIIELAQRITLISTGLSSQADFWIFFAEQNPNERVNIMKRIGFGDDKKKFWEIFNRETFEIRSWIGIRSIGGRKFFFNKEGFIAD